MVDISKFLEIFKEIIERVVKDLRPFISAND